MGENDKPLFGGLVRNRVTGAIHRDPKKIGYCEKHRRPMIDIGGEQKCVACRDEARKK